MTSVQDSYAAEVKGTKDRLKRLKDRYQKRAIVRRVGPAGPAAQVYKLAQCQDNPSYKCMRQGVRIAK